MKTLTIPHHIDRTGRFLGRPQARQADGHHQFLQLLRLDGRGAGEPLQVGDGLVDLAGVERQAREAKPGRDVTGTLRQRGEKALPDYRPSGAEVEAGRSGVEEAVRRAAAVAAARRSHLRLVQG
jgi:hypothetical protein